jgi:hypothetical protein
MQLFAENELPVLPVVDGSIQNRVIGLVRRSDLAKAYLRKLHGEVGPPSDGFKGDALGNMGDAMG